MPKNFGFESRPFDVDPPAFFDANLTRICCCGCSPPKTTLLNDNKECYEFLLKIMKKIKNFKFPFKQNEFNIYKDNLIKYKRSKDNKLAKKRFENNNNNIIKNSSEYGNLQN